MRKKWMKCIVAAAAASACMASAVLPVLAESSLKSRGNLVYEEGAVSLYAADFDYLLAEADEIQREQELTELASVRTEGSGRKENIRSRGVVNYSDGQVIMDSSDFIRLADRLDGLEDAYRDSTAGAADALKQMGTYFTADGAVTHVPGEAASGENGTKLPYHKICDGILQSQSVAHLAAQKISAAVSNNLSKGTAAWVDGTLVVGNGADNTTFYNNGYASGEEAGYQKGHAAGVREAETNINTSSASYREGYARGKADAAPVVLTGTISDFEATTGTLMGSVQIPAGLTYVCAGMSVSECGVCIYPAVTDWWVSSEWNYDSGTGTVNFILNVGGEKHPASEPVISYTIMYMP